MLARDKENSEDAALQRLKPGALLAAGLGERGSEAGSNGQPSAAIGPAMDDLLAELFPEYRFEGRLGGGGFGTVFRAEHRKLKRRVAIKILSAALTRSASAVARFEREIEAVARLDDVRIVRAFDGGQRGGVWFLAMELVEGVDFGTLSQALGPLRPADACELARQAALALQHAHERRLVHRDVKPGNLMLARTPEGTPVVKVLDFGLAQLIHGDGSAGELTVSSDFLGTVDYVAPEQIENPRESDARADIYGLGATLYRLLSGSPPHTSEGDTSSIYAKLLRIARAETPSITVRCASLPAGLAAVVDRMVAREPGQRFASAAEVVAALAPFAAGNDVAALLAQIPGRGSGPDDTVPITPFRFARRRRQRRLGVLAAIILTTLSGAWWLNRKPVPAAKSPAVIPPLPAALALGPMLVHPRGITLGPDGALYGGAIFGGASNLGAIYKFTAPTSTVALIHFSGTNGPALGRMPGRQLLLARDGRFYGVTERGGRGDLGTLFRFDPRQTPPRLETLWNFEGSDGSEPLAGLIEDNIRPGVFYGGTQMGGAGNSGTLFRLDCTGGAPQLKTLAEFTGDAGAAPGRRLVSALAQTADGTLFGTTPEGGPMDAGTAFRLGLDGSFKSLIAFGQGPQRLYNPTGGITLGRDGNLYGVGRVERDGHGAVFQLTPAGELHIFARFGPPNGSEPASTLLCGPDGSLYGTTLLGGEHHRGTLFRLSPTGELKTLASFGDIGGQPSKDPWALPTFGADGNLYGTIEEGGLSRNGLLYRVTPAGELTMLVDFSGR
jgi:uncharacterized repeat protein (TIGR03803 family)